MRVPKYRFSNSKSRFVKVIKFIDFIGYRIFNKDKNLSISDENFHSIALIQLGHIGDFVLLIPTIVKIRKSFKGKIILCVNPVNEGLAKMMPEIDEVIVNHHPSFYRGNKIPFLNVIKEFRAIKADLIFELRGDLRIIIFLYLFSKYKYLVGFEVGGLGFLLTNILDYPFKEHITKTYEKIFAILKINNSQEINIGKIFTDILQKNQKNQKSIVIAIGAGAPSRDWGDNNFVSLIRLLQQNTNNEISLIGKIESSRLSLFENIEHIDNKLNKTSLIEAFKTIAKAQLFVGLESGMTHVASVMSVNTIAIYSDTTNLEEWKPLQNLGTLDLIKSYVECGGCGLLECQDNICMRKITVEEVFNKISLRLKRLNKK